MSRHPLFPTFLVVLLLAGCAKSPRSLVASDAPSTEALRLVVLYPITFISSPRPTHQQPIAVPPSFTVHWIGRDPGAKNGLPTGYLTRLVSWSDIDPASPGGATQLQVRAFFQADYATNRGAWTATTANEQVVADQAPQEVRYFAVVGQYAPGESDSVDMLFSLDQNVLTYRATREFLGPRITVSNEFLNYTKTFASLDPAPARSIAVPAGEPITIRSQAQAPVGRLVEAFRWALDLASIEDETPRRNDKDLAHWSAWTPAINAQHEDVVGPFPAGDAKKPPHRYYLEARDDFGGINLVVIEIAVQARLRPPGQLLLVDDLYGAVTNRNQNTGMFNYTGPYPMEAEQDSFYNAVGGFPDSLKRLGTPGADPNALSVAGAFAGFDYDTLDYRFWPTEDIDVLSQYRAVAWYSDGASAARSGAKFSTLPATLLRAINSAQRANTLAAYVANGGKLWLFGEGATSAIANGYWSRFGPGAARLPYTAGDERDDILVPGNFLYDFCHLRSTLMAPAFKGTEAGSLHGAIPYLPEFAGPASQGDRSHDPRIGPSSARTAQRWSGLPRLTIAGYRGANANPAERIVRLTFFVMDPLTVLEGNRSESVLDTLYLHQAIQYDPEQLGLLAADGKPNAVDYHGAENGEVVWFGFGLHYFELAQARQVVEVVMRNFGIAPLPAGVRQGPGTVVPATGAEDVPIAQRMR